MPIYRLLRDKARSSGEWHIEWDAVRLLVRDPSGALVFEHPIERAHQIVELYELETEGKISFATSAGSLTFKPNEDAAREIRELILQGLHSDTIYRKAQKRHARMMIPIGTIAFVVCGSLFSLYCWWVSRAPEPPKGNWYYVVGGLVYIVLLALLGLALAGPYVVYIALRQLSRIRQVERFLSRFDAA
jgi:hypothetical protein